MRSLLPRLRFVVDRLGASLPPSWSSINRKFVDPTISNSFSHKLRLRVLALHKKLNKLPKPTPATVASSLRNTIAFARSRLESIRDHLPSNLQPYLPQPSPPPRPSYLSARTPRPIISVLSKTQAPPSPELLLTLLLTTLILVFMSWRNWGRYSPFASPPARHTPTVTENDYHYLGPDDIVDPPRSRNDTYFLRHGSRADADNPNAPDILVLKHRGTTYPLHFPAFSIGEGLLSVGELRRYVAEKTNTPDWRRIKLLYKGKQLKDDAVACCEEGLKQNSELMCVVTEGPTNGGGNVGGRGMGNSDSSESADEDEMLDTLGGPRDSGVRVDVDGTIIGGPDRRKRKGHRGGKKTRKTTPPEPTPSSSRDGYLNPDPTFVPNLGTTPASRSSTPPNPIHTTTSNSSSKPSLNQLDAIASTFHTKFLPQCVQFTNHPPPDAKARTTEYTKLSESILAQVLLKLDEVDTGGDPEARDRRRGLVKEVQEVLGSLDAVGKGR